MGELLFLAAIVFVGIMFVVYVASSMFELAGVWGFVLAAVAIVIGFTIAHSSSSGGEKK